MDPFQERQSNPQEVTNPPSPRDEDRGVRSTVEQEQLAQMRQLQSGHAHTARPASQSRFPRGKVPLSALLNSPTKQDSPPRPYSPTRHFQPRSPGQYPRVMLQREQTLPDEDPWQASASNEAVGRAYTTFERMASNMSTGSEEDRIRVQPHIRPGVDPPQGSENDPANSNNSNSGDGNNSQRRRRWTAAEDQLLITLVEENGPRKWDNMAEFFEGRCGRHLRLRWINHLSMNVRNERFSEQEDRILLSAQRRFGNQWSRISRELPGRSDNAVKNRFHTLTRRGAAGASTSTNKENKEDNG
mmetsp:Transcript_12547/g.22627  ORF Transcript_12547/g.22627 Transcript_12547/m.22627 type:complete len:300 (-) Transcript_12547:307-1206(-)|eukprot:CAMPEP_0182447050 /NCGR_PEP_ID=MMETSP1172-20130603/10832_1 /TAXON_ID=708627 /ORGANISM="Timspurckia oligopyrenoides, Strain CCMP3278" /LENGTH=299 /DNA_ID=CAMNT_0024643329 /DNA_START=360 /DNA_END=1259 /DNA_ORIENTATION=-